MSDEGIHEKYLPLLAIAKDRSRRLELLELDNLRLAARFKNKHPKEFAQLILGLSAWEMVGHFKSEITRRSAAAKQANEEDKKNAEAMERLAKAEEAGYSIIREGHPVEVARDFLAQVRPNLMVTADSWLDYTVNHYREFEKATIRADLQKWMDNAVNHETGNRVLVNKSVLDNVIDALASATHVPASTMRPPIWLKPGEDDPEPKHLLACSNGLLDVSTGALHANTPRFYTRSGLPYAYEDPFFVLPPYEFLRFLESIWPEDEGGLHNKLSLQEWFGYLLTPGNLYQKILVLMGESRAGKGVIIKLIEALVGYMNVASVKFASLNGNFGLEPLLGKSVMVVPDLVINKDSHKAMDILLALSGDDMVGVDRKFRQTVNERLDVKMVFGTNFSMDIPDKSGAFANRLHPLLFVKSFAGREDITLAERIIKNELPGLLHWALEGRARLEARGHLVLPPESLRVLGSIRTQSGPVKMFVASKCVVEHGAVTAKADLFRAFELYCESLDVPLHYTPESFGREMAKNATGFTRVTPQRITGDDGRRRQVYLGIRLTDEAAAELEEGDDDY